MLKIQTSVLHNFLETNFFQTSENFLRLYYKVSIISEPVQSFLFFAVIYLLYIHIQ